jgi:hypothetical protein
LVGVVGVKRIVDGRNRMRLDLSGIYMSPIWVTGWLYTQEGFEVVLVGKKADEQSTNAHTLIVPAMTI